MFYKGEDSLRHKVLAVEELAGAQGADYAIRNLISAKKLVIESTIKNPLTGKLETQVNTVHGPTAVFQTTTNPRTDAETRSRFILISVDESPEQTRAILEAQRHSHTLRGLETAAGVRGDRQTASRLPAVAQAARGAQSVRAVADLSRRLAAGAARPSQISEPDFGRDVPVSVAAARP